MLEDQVAYLLQRYLGNYVLGLSKEALKISVWQGDVELTNMQLKPEALNALKLPVKVKAGFLGSVKLKVPWSRIGQDPVLVSLDRIFLLAEPATQVEGSSEDAVQEVKKSRIREMETKLLESRQILTTEMNKSWLGSLINTIIGNLKLSISNIHIRYEDLESNPGHPFAAGVTLEKLLAVTVDDNGKETFITGGALEHIQKSVELEQLSVYFDSDIVPWHLSKPWKEMLPFEWSQAFRYGTKYGKPADGPTRKHNYLLQPVTGNAKYSKRRPNESANSGQPLQKALVNLDDVTLSLSKNGYRDLLRLADNFAAFNQRLRYAHYRPLVSVKSDPRSWWRYAYKVITDQIKKASGKLSWEQVLRYAKLRKKYISLYASLLKSDTNRAIVDDNSEIEELDRELDIELILQWRMLAHKFVEQPMESDLYLKKQKAKKSWWSFGWDSQSAPSDENEPGYLTNEDWEQLNNIIGYKEGDDDAQLLLTQDNGNVLHTMLEVHMKRNATKLVHAQECLAELSCENLGCLMKFYSESKNFDLKLGSYRVSSPHGLLAEDCLRNKSATASDSLIGVFRYKPFDVEADWSMVAKASPCYVTYLKDSVDQIINFFESNAVVSQALALDTAAAVQMTIDEVKRSAQQQVNKALKDHARFFLDLDIAAPKITIPTDFCPDNTHATRLLLDLGHLLIRTQDDHEAASHNENNMYFQFDLVLSDVSAFLVDGDHHWSQSLLNQSAGSSRSGSVCFLPVIDKCGVIVNLQQIRLENPSYPSTRLAVRIPSLGFHFSPARYHRLMQVVKIFQGEDSDNADLLRPWDQADFEGWLSILNWKGVGSREAVWQRRYLCLVGPFLYVLEKPGSRSYKQYLSLRGKQLYQVPPEIVGNIGHVLAVCDLERSNNKVVEDANALILRCESEDSRRIWQSRLQGAVYRASGSAPITSLSETSSDSDDLEENAIDKRDLVDISKMERVFITGALDELKMCFSYNSQHDTSLMKVLLAKENRLFEFRAIGGRVELSIRESDMFIGTVLKSLEVEDLVSHKGPSQAQPLYLARSFIRGSDEPSVFNGSLERNQSEGDDNFYEASENLNDPVDSPTESHGNLSEYISSKSYLPSEKPTLKPPSFSRIDGVLPDVTFQSGQDHTEVSDNLDSFVKAQIVIFDQNSVLYDNIDKQVTVTLATLSFFCRRPIIVAILEFVNAINVEDDSCEYFSDTSSTAIVQHENSEEHKINNSQQLATDEEEPVVKGLLGKGKSRVMFSLTLNMARAQILLMKEDGAKLATLSQDNFLTDIKVFPSSFSIKASLGNLRISDDSLNNSHTYFWACDMRNPGGSSFVELAFTSFNADDEEYEGYEYSLLGQLSEVQIVYLNRFIQEIVSYFMGLVPNTPKDVVKVKDQVTNSEKWFTTSEIEGSPAVKLDLSLRKPIILMPRRTDSLDYLKLDIVHITVQNTFQWSCGSKQEISAVHMDILTVLVEDINLTVGTGTELSESIIQDVKGVSIVIQRSLRDLLHQIPSAEVAIKMDKLKAVLSNREYQIITECALENISETPNIIPPLDKDTASSSTNLIEHVVPRVLDASGTETQTEEICAETQKEEIWITTKVSVVIGLVELCLHCGIARDVALATLQVSGVWLLYKSNTLGEGFLSSTLKGFTVIDDREGTEQELRLAVRKPVSIGYTAPELLTDYKDRHMVEKNVVEDNETKFNPTMLILDAKFAQYSTSVSLCIQRPQLLVALDFLLAVVEFFVPTVGSMISNEDAENSSQVVDAVILDQSTYSQPSAEFSLSPQKPLVVDDERFDHFIYDGRGGTLYLQDRLGLTISSPRLEAIIFVGSRKKLQFKNVYIKNGKYLDACILLGSNSSYSVSEDDKVYLVAADEGPEINSPVETAESGPSQSTTIGRSSEFTIELQAIGPELTFYNSSKDVGESLNLSNKLLHAQLDAFCRLILKGDTVEMSANALGFTMESNGIRILEPFDTSVEFSNASGKTNIHLAVSDIFMNFSFSILRLFLAVEDDILAFLRMTSKKMTVVCSEFNKIGTIKNPKSDQTYAFWRPHAPPGFAVLGDYLTPLDKPPTKGVLAVNTSFVRVKRPESFKLVWPLSSGDNLDSETDLCDGDGSCSIWYPEAPKGYVAMGCVVSPGRAQPSLSSAFCVLASLASPCSLRDCITISIANLYSSHLAFWRVYNSVGTFLPADPTTLSSTGRAYELRLALFRVPGMSSETSTSSYIKQSSSGIDHTVQSERSSTLNSGRHFEAVASFQLIWWNQTSSSRKKLSIWRPIVPQGMVYFGDIAVKGYEPPNTSIVLHGSEDDVLFKAPIDFQFLGQIKKHRGMENISFWLPQAPPGFVPLGCVACKGTPKQTDLSSLRCMRSDMVTGDQFSDESIWDTCDSKFVKEPFSIWGVGNELGTFIVRSGFKKPPRRFALKLAEPNLPNGSEGTVIDAEVKTFSAALFDDYGGLMVPLFNISLSSIGFGLHGRSDNLNSTVSFSLAARSYNDKYEMWEPLVEPVDGVLRYQYDLNSPGTPSQLRITSTRDLNLNVTVSNANMIFQAYASWNNLTQVHETYKERETLSRAYGEIPIVDIHHKRNYYVIPQNKLGQNIFIRATEIRGLQNIIKMPSGGMTPLKVPVSNNMLDAHLKGDLCKKLRTMVTIMIAEAEFPRSAGLASHQYTLAVCLTLDQSLSSGSPLNQQSARTCGTSSVNSLSSELVYVDWNEIFFFKIENLDYYMVELILTDMGKGDPVGYFSAPLKQIARTQDNSDYFNFSKELNWIEFSSMESSETAEGKNFGKSYGRVKCAVLLSPSSGVESSEQSLNRNRKSGFIQISPTREGPWTTVRLNYAAPAACWRLGNDVVASEVSLNNGNRYVNIRSLVSVRNNTDFTLDLCLKLRAHDHTNLRDDAIKDIQIDANELKTDHFFETEKFNPATGWISAAVEPKLELLDSGESHQGTLGAELPSGWEWVDDWHLDVNSTLTAQGWVYAPDIESLKWPDSCDPVKSVNYARQRRWIRNRKPLSRDGNRQIFIGPLAPGETLPLPLFAVTQSGSCILLLRPSNANNHNGYTWSSVMDKPGQLEDSDGPKRNSEICVSSLMESEELLYCPEITGTSSSTSRGLWFCLSIQATEIAKDIHSDSIEDWSLTIKSPFSISNFFPLAAEYSVLEMQSTGHFLACSRGVFGPGETVKVFNADIRNPLYFSLLPQKGWLPIHEAVLISHPIKVPAKTISLRSSVSGRIVQIILEQNHNKETPVLAKTVRVYSPYWFAITRCPPLTFRILDMSSKKSTQRIAIPFQSKKDNEVILQEITEEEINDGYTIASALNFKLIGLSASISQLSNEHFGPVKDLSPLGDMDGSLDLHAYDADGNCMLLFVSSKPCPYPSVPTKVISVRPFITFTNRLGKDIFLKLSSEDQPKVLHASDSRVSFVYREAGGSINLQVRMENTEWSYPFQIFKEDTICLVLRKHDGPRIFLRTEIRGYEEGSRFIVVFRLGSPDGPMRIENRTTTSAINVHQSGIGNDAWISLGPLSTTSFAWEDPYGQKLLDAKIHAGASPTVWTLDLDKPEICSTACDGKVRVSFRVVEMGDIKVARFVEDRISESNLGEGVLRNSNTQSMTEENATPPLEMIVELGVVGVSLVDHRPKELSYLYLERVFISYSAGYDGGTTSRFKLILGYLQLDNQLPLTLMPVMLAPEQASDMHHPVFKMTITMRNENPDGIQVYPYIYIRVTDKCWRLNIHEPIIWALIDSYNNLQLDRIPQNSSVTQIDPEIHINLIDVSEVRLKLSMETAPAERPNGVLGVWSPLLSAVGNAFKIQVHLRKVMHRDRFMRKSSVVPAITNRIWRDLIHNPLHLIFSVDVLGMTSSTLASLSKGFAELSTDGQFLQLRSKQVWSRKITGVGDGILQGTEALAQGVAFGVSGVVKKPVENARENGVLGLAHGLGQAFLGFIVQPVSGALDFFSLTVDGIGASCSRCLEVLSNKTTLQRIRNPRVIRADNILREYCEREAVGQMILYLAEASRHFGCTEIFKEPSKFAWSDYYEDHFIVPFQRIVLVTNKRVMLLQCVAPNKMDKKPCKIMWDVSWEELMALELAKAGHVTPSHLILHLKNFRRSETFVRVIKCSSEEEPEEGREPQAVRICSVVRKMWKAHQSNEKSLTLKVPSSQRYVSFSCSEDEWRDSRNLKKSIIKSRELSSSGSISSDEKRFVKHVINFTKVWSSEQESRSRCTLCKKQVVEDSGICCIWRPICPDGYVSVGDIARVGIHPPNVAAVYRNSNKLFALPVGYDLVWRNCPDDYISPISIWHPRAPEGYVSLGCVAIPSYEEPEPNVLNCVAESLAEDTVFEDQKVWSAPDSYPWACHIYQVRSDALHFVALRQPREDSDWKPVRVRDEGQPSGQ